MNLNKLAEAADIRKYVALNHELKGAALVQLGMETDAIAELETAVAIADAVQYQPIRWGSRSHLVELHRQSSLEQEVKSASCEAAQIIQNIAAGLTDESLRVTILRSKKRH